MKPTDRLWNVYITFPDGSVPESIKSGSVFAVSNSHGREVRSDNHGRIRDIDLPDSIRDDLATKRYSKIQVYWVLPSGQLKPLGRYVLELDSDDDLVTLIVKRPKRNLKEFFLDGCAVLLKLAKYVL